jgi:methionine synthase II (cobalamin-independent)
MLKTSIGSLPFNNIERAVDVVFEFCPDVPFWPQLPRRSFYEDFYIQSLENLPSLVIDESSCAAYMDTRRTEGVEQFYEDVSAGNFEPYRISDRAGPGLFRLLERVHEIESRVRFIKVQLTGPFTIGLGIKDEKGRSIIHDAAFFDIIKKGLNLKARWLISTIKVQYPGIPIILFFDEPAMVSIGSAFVNVDKQVVTTSINEAIDGLDATIGVHCCGNTDWPVLFATGVDLINYDASAFMETIFYYRKELTEFLNRGGRIAPGIVPTLPDAIDRTTTDVLRSQWGKLQRHLVEAGCDPGDEEILVTTACGLGTIDESHTMKTLELLRSL